jgi:NitT/TauT family transport system ATP-binding protein
MIRVENLYKKYRLESPFILDNISFEVSKEDTLSIIGPSGCGKTTLLQILGGLLPATDGRVEIDGEEIYKPRKKTAFFFQDFGLLRWETAEENAGLSMRINGIGKQERQQTVGLLFDDLGISGQKHSYPVQLSGGEKQRVAIARSLAVNPDLLLMDEPFSALDAMTREKLQDIILAKWRERKFTAIIVTHNIEEAVFLGRRIMIMGDKPAKIKNIIDNPGFGMDNFRLRDEYFQVMKEVRSNINTRSEDVAATSGNQP